MNILLEGTMEEVTRQLQHYAGQKLRVFVETQEGDDADSDLLVPPFAVGDEAHLEALLLEGLNSPAWPFTDDMEEQLCQEARTRLAQKQSEKHSAQP